MNQKSSLYQTVYRNMSMKETSELVSIWVRNDRSEWTDEAFEIIRDILVERLGNVPPQEQSALKSTSRRKKRVKEKRKTSLVEILVFSPMLVVMIMIVIAIIIQPRFIEGWLGNVFLFFLTLSAFVPGLYFGWMSWFRVEQTKQRIIDNLPKNKQALGSFYRVYTLFIPEHHVPMCFLYLVRFMSLSFLVGGLMIFFRLLELF